MSNKTRLDVLLMDNGYFDSRPKAQATIMSGLVYINGQRVDKPGTSVPNDAAIEVRGNAIPYVSRGGLKLEKAMATFPIDLNGTICGDIGASTGGFTDCMLQNGAKKVYSIDVGHGQLAWSLRQDERVVCMEKTNFRYVTADNIADVIEFAATDVSFISLTKILPPAHALLKDGAEMVCLIKPQFEAGREHVGKKGVVRDANIHEEVILKIADFCLENGFEVLHMDYSPIKGPEGNIEYLLHIRKQEAVEKRDMSAEIKELVQQANQTLK